MDRSERSERRALSRLGLLNGLVIGLALAAGLWLPAIVTFLGLPVGALIFLTILTSAALVITLSALAGWLSGRLNHTVASVFIWLLAALLIVVVIGYRSYQLSTFIAWLLDPVLWGRQIFPENPAMLAGILLSGIFILLALVVLGLLQEYRLEGILAELKPGGRLTGYGWTRLLLLPLLLALPAAFVTGTIFGDRANSRMIRDMARAIDVAATYEGDLFALGLEEDINYAALRGVQEQLGAAYTLELVETDPQTAQTVFVAHFDDGGWINCRFINQQLSFCEDGSEPYVLGLASLITGNSPACDDCLPQIDERWDRWLSEQRAAMGDEPQISFVRQRGAHVLMRAVATDGSRALHCWLEGAGAVRVMQCEEARP